MEEFAARVFKGGKVTVPKRLRDLFGVKDGDYVRLALVEVLKAMVIFGVLLGRFFLFLLFFRTFRLLIGLCGLGLFLLGL